MHDVDALARHWWMIVPFVVCSLEVLNIPTLKELWIVAWFSSKESILGRRLTSMCASLQNCGVGVYLLTSGEAGST